MPTITDYLNYAETAFAAYANNLVLGHGNASAYENDAEMAHTQAQRFDATWSVLGQQDLSDGFSAVLLQQVDAQGNAIGDKVFAIRGTEASHWGVDYLTDVVNIASLGTEIGMSQYNSLEGFYQTLVTQGTLGATEQIVVTGHSLGGFLAQAFTAKHDSVVSTTYTYNSPGFSAATGVISNMGTQLLEFFGITDASIPSEKIYNVRAINGLSATAGLGQMIGSVQGVSIEASLDPVHNHSIATLTDTLALYGAIAQIDQNISVAKLNVLFEAASNTPASSLERALNPLLKLFGLDVIMESGGTRNAYYQALSDLNAKLPTAGAPSPYQLASLASSDYSSTLAKSQADTTEGLAYRYALKELNPFVVIGADYSTHNDNGELDLYDAETGEGTLTEQYLKDRAKFLSWKLNLNSKDESYGVTTDYNNMWTFTDVGSGYSVTAGPGGALYQLLADKHQVTFGSDLLNDTLAGGEASDYLYGQWGTDTLTGNEGADYLDGGTGADKLTGGEGADRLYGGADNDTLDGGLGNDTLVGGEGTDTYVIKTGEGTDTILDADGAGVITLDGAQIKGRAGTDAEHWQTPAADTWLDTENNITYTRIVEGGETRLLIHQGNNNLIVRNWQEGGLGIVVCASKPPVAPVSEWREAA